MNKFPFGESGKREAHIVLHKHESYIVPIIARAIDISELLQGYDSGLSVKEIQGLTGYPASTIYRILRTLVAFGYVVRDLGGTYQLHCYAIRTRKNSNSIRTKEYYICGTS